MAHIAPLFPLFLGKFPVNSNYLIFFLGARQKEHKENTFSYVRTVFLHISCSFYSVLLLPLQDNQRPTSPMNMPADSFMLQTCAFIGHKLSCQGNINNLGL